MAPGTRGITSIELLLDSAAEALVRADWDALASAGMSSMAGHDAASNRPHVTLLARSTPVPHPLHVAADALPLPVLLGPPLLFGDGDRRVLARSVVPSADLLALQRAVLSAADHGDRDGGDRLRDGRDQREARDRAAEAANGHGDERGDAGAHGELVEHRPGVNDGRHYFAPGRWTPHMTLARRIRLADLPQALRLLGPPIYAQGIALRRWDAATATVSSVDIR